MAVRQVVGIGGDVCSLSPLQFANCTKIISKAKRMKKKKELTFLGLETHMHLEPPIIISDGGLVVPVLYTWPN